MAYKNSQTSVTYVAGANLSAKQFYFVVMAADGEIDAATDGAAAIGVLLNDPAAKGRAAEVAIGGDTRVTAGGTVAAGAAVASDLNGAAITAASGDVILGTAVTGGDSGEVITINFQPRGAA